MSVHGANMGLILGRQEQVGPMLAHELCYLGHSPYSGPLHHIIVHHDPMTLRVVCYRDIFSVGPIF